MAKFLVESEEGSIMLAEVAMILNLPSQQCFKTAVVDEKRKMHIDESPTTTPIVSLPALSPPFPFCGQSLLPGGRNIRDELRRRFRNHNQRPTQSIES